MEVKFLGGRIIWRWMLGIGLLIAFSLIAFSVYVYTHTYSQYDQNPSNPCLEADTGLEQVMQGVGGSIGDLQPGGQAGGVFIMKCPEPLPHDP